MSAHDRAVLKKWLSEIDLELVFDHLDTNGESSCHRAARSQDYAQTRMRKSFGRTRQLQARKLRKHESAAVDGARARRPPARRAPLAAGQAFAATAQSAADAVKAQMEKLVRSPGPPRQDLGWGGGGVPRAPRRRVLAQYSSSTSVRLGLPQVTSRGIQ